MLDDKQKNETLYIYIGYIYRCLLMYPSYIHQELILNDELTLPQHGISVVVSHIDKEALLYCILYIMRRLKGRYFACQIQISRVCRVRQ